MNNNFLSRVGSFFILVGLALLLMFVASVMSSEIHALYLLTSLVSFFVAFWLRRDKPESNSGRFRVIHQARERRHQHRQNGSNKPPVRAGGIFGAFHRESRHDRKHREESEKNQKSES